MPLHDEVRKRDGDGREVRFRRHITRNARSESPHEGTRWLDGQQLSYIRTHLHMAYEMNRQLLAHSGLSFADYDALTALSAADGARMSITVVAAPDWLGAQPGVHHVRRMAGKGW